MSESQNESISLTRFEKFGWKFCGNRNGDRSLRFDIRAINFSETLESGTGSAMPNLSRSELWRTTHSLGRQRVTLRITTTQRTANCTHLTLSWAHNQGGEKFVWLISFCWNHYFSWHFVVNNHSKAHVLCFPESYVKSPLKWFIVHKMYRL